MKAPSKIALYGLLVLLIVVLATNLQYLFTAPVANSWVWWRGDETWLMAQYGHLVKTGQYNNPLAPGSAYSQGSGLFLGSCYITAALYGLPMLAIAGHTIMVGRTITFIIALLTLIAMWMIAERYRVGPVLRAFGCVLLAGSVCFFITSHSARSDMLVGLTILLLAGLLPLAIERLRARVGVLLGLLLPATLLVNAHVFLHSFLLLGYLIWSVGGFKSVTSFLRWATPAVGGFVLLFLVQLVLLGSSSLLGPFSGASGMMPLLQVLHPRSDIANFNGRLVAANLLAPGMIWIVLVLAAGLVVARVRYQFRLLEIDRPARRLLVCAALVILSSIFLEFYEARYLIFVLPTIVLSFLIVLTQLVWFLPRRLLVMFSIALGCCAVYGLWHYERETSRIGSVSDAITAANKAAVMDALTAIHSSRAGRPRIFAAVPVQSIVMDDSCEMVTPVIYIQPSGPSITRTEIWNRAKIDYAIICNPAHVGDWSETDSNIDWSARSRSKIIFKRLGPFSDVGRPYEMTDLERPDTLLVYEFQR